MNVQMNVSMQNKAEMRQRVTAGMKRMALMCAVFSLVGASALASPVALRVMSFSKNGQIQTQQGLSTESDWLYIQLPEAVVADMGNMEHLQLTVAGAPAFLSISMNGKMKLTDGAVGVSVARTDKKLINQDVQLTLTNTETGQSYTFTEHVYGTE